MNGGRHDATVDVSQRDCSTMQTLSNAGQENAAIPLITVYLLGVLTWTLLVTATNIFNLLSTKADNERGEPDDREDRNQFLATPPVENEPTNRPRSCIDFENNCNSSTPIRTIRSHLDNDTTTDEPLEESYEDAKRKLSFHATLDKGSDKVVASLEEGSNLRKVHFSLSMDRSRERFGNDVPAVSKPISKDSNDENCAKNECDRENGATTSNHEERLADERSETNVTENTDSSVRRALTATFLTSILQESSWFKPKSQEHFDEATTSMDANVSRETRMSCAENDSDIFDELEELLNRPTDDKRIPPQMEDDRPGEPLEVVPPNDSNPVAEESAIYSSISATQSRIEERVEVENEEEEKAGPPPETKQLKNGQEAESTILLSQAQSTGYGKEEEDLNAMIRRMIISELKRHRNKKQMTLKRAYSDTESVMKTTRRDSKTRTGLFGFKDRTFFRDLLELEESMRKRVDTESESEATVFRIDRKPSKPAQSTGRDENATIDGSANVDGARGSINSLGTMCNLDTDIPLERKISVHRLTEAPESIESGNVPAEQRQTRASKFTQTEHAYVIHAIRSCPLRKGRPLLQFQLHRLANGRETASSKAVFANLDCTRFVFRKASDNLIYERGKASGSPSYIPSPERFRWKYVKPSTAK